MGDIWQAVWYNTSNFWQNFWHTLYNGLPKSAQLAGFLLHLTQALTVLLISLAAARAVKGWAARLMGRSKVSPNVIALVGNSAFILVLILGFFWLLGVLGASLTTVLASLSIVTVAFGLALQDILKNLVAGVYILLEQPFKIGDQIAVKGVTGEVEGIDIRSTIMRTDEGLQVLVPNTIVFTEILTNRSAYNTHRVSIQLQGVRVAFEDLSRIVNDTLLPFEAIDRTPSPLLKIQSLDDGIATVVVDYWQRGTAFILPDVLARLKDTFPGAKITVLSGATPPVPATENT